MTRRTLDAMTLRALLRGLPLPRPPACPACGSDDIEQGAPGAFRCRACDHRWDTRD